MYGKQMGLALISQGRGHFARPSKRVYTKELIYSSWSNLHSILEVKSIWIRPESLTVDAWMVALLEHVEIDPLLVLEIYALSLGMGIEGVHEHQRNITVVILV